MIREIRKLFARQTTDPWALAEVTESGELIDMTAYLLARLDRMRQTMKRMRGERESCAYEEMYEGGPWVCTSCNMEWDFDGRTPQEALMQYCSLCGRKIAAFGKYVEEPTSDDR